MTSRDPAHLPPGRSLRAPLASINEGPAEGRFTLRVLRVDEGRGNEANGEESRAGAGDDRARSHGPEGGWPIDPAAGTDPKREELEAARRRTARPVLA